ncbi:cytidylyltransferase domain-containing protein [Rhodoferax saidenbachensis]|uniref:Spore coat polysaccharide biosynthesis protein SpsF n=1 Tax=Rhodoferax saidenbachensis TaxID=1484693 RepID=A0ABU1ZKH3_9BURK|nr:NTP transferase domain-containing protein [Rhodoferax saidenbachensis]MDR7306050.1 spore coat polysaccharide biosynthesis protein SpsF [Rhodoferax saidenbachensis]
MNLGKVGVIVASRTGSTRLPGKALLPLGDLPMVLFLLRRLQPLRNAVLVLATTTLESDDILADMVSSFGVPVFRGSPTDLVQRYCDAARHFGFDTVVRITADCPFVDAALIEWCLQQAAALPEWDVATTKGQFPVGLDAEIYLAGLMQSLNDSAPLSADDREHLTLHLYNNNYRVARISPPADWAASSKVFTVDTQADYELAQDLVASFKGADFSVKELLLR